MVATGWQFQRQPALSLTTMLLFVPVYVLAAAGEELGWSGYVIAVLVTLLWGSRTLDRFRSRHARRSRRSARLGHERTAARADATRAAGTGRSSTTG